MSLAFQQTITLQTRGQDPDTDGILSDPTAASGVFKKVTFETAPREVDFSAYGIDPAHGARMYVPFADRSAYAVDAEVVYLGVTYLIKSAGAVMEHPRLGYAEYLLERVQ